MRSFTCNTNDAGQRLDKFITKTVRGLPQSLLYKYIRKKRIKVNGSRAHENDILSVGDVVEMYIPDEFFDGMPDAGKASGKASAAPTPSAADTPLSRTAEFARIRHIPEIVYEDENLILCDKRPGVLVHTGDEGDSNRAAESERETLLFALQAYLWQKGEYDPEAEHSFAPALCNRIDRNTGGIVIFAKNAPTLRLMNEAIRAGYIEKRYLCAVHGRFPDARIFSGYLRKDYKTKTVAVYDTQKPGSREIRTGCTPLSYNRERDLTLLEVRLFTGRTHQIRAHLAHVGYPLLGEGKYGENKNDRKAGYTHQALYSYRITFALPPEYGDTPLSYLCGRTYTVRRENVRFLSLFPDARLPEP